MSYVKSSIDDFANFVAETTEEPEPFDFKMMNKNCCRKDHVAMYLVYARARKVIKDRGLKGELIESSVHQIPNPKLAALAKPKAAESGGQGALFPC